MRPVFSFLKVIALSRLSLLGAGLVTSCVLADLILIIGELFFFESNPYIGIFVYMFFPGLAVIGLLMIPAGIFRRARKSGTRLSIRSVSGLVESKKINLLHVVQIVLFLSAVNLVIFAIVGYRGFHYTESREFCGELCHEVMHPELTTYKRSPHSEISCVECHIGSGADWFVKSKLSGARQVLAVMLDDFSRPIETPIHNLRPARDVCEVCHRPEIFHGDRIKIIENFKADEKNTKTYTVLNLRIGTGGEHGRGPQGIHWHVSRNHEVHYYATDRKREKIVWVRVTNPDGSTRVWTQRGFETSGGEPEHEKLRLMDCVDCHNRPTHIYLSPDQALDQWMASGLIDASVPWIRKLSEEIIQKDYASTEEAKRSIAELPALYRERYPEHWLKHRAGVEAAVEQLQEIHGLFVYPEMKIRWNTYNSLIGHPTSHTAACFRCHNGVLRDSEEEPITLECEACHYVLANQETNPRILRVLQPQAFGSE